MRRSVLSGKGAILCLAVTPLAGGPLEQRSLDARTEVGGGLVYAFGGMNDSGPPSTANVFRPSSHGGNQAPFLTIGRMFSSLACRRCRSLRCASCQSSEPSIPVGARPFYLGSASTRSSCPFVNIKHRHIYLVVPFTTSCRNVARNGSRSDFKNRMFRPITRRWGTRDVRRCGIRHRAKRP